MHTYEMEQVLPKDKIDWSTNSIFKLNIFILYVTSEARMDLQQIVIMKSKDLREISRKCVCNIYIWHH